jgi:hypothetical protein
MFTAFDKSGVAVDGDYVLYPVDDGNNRSLRRVEKPFPPAPPPPN